MADVRIKIDGKEYPFPEEYTLGEQRVLKVMSGLLLKDIGDIDPTDPDLVTWLLWVVLHRENPKVTPQDVESKTFADVEMIGTEDEAPEVAAIPPAPPGETGTSPNGSTVSGGSGGDLSPGATSPATSGSPL
jgi:hypothetical protein